jgi:hypothetical protein
MCFNKRAFVRSGTLIAKKGYDEDCVVYQEIKYAAQRKYAQISPEFRWLGNAH